MRSYLRSYANRGYRAVRGWLGPDTIRLVLRIADTQVELGMRGPVAEIGVHHGKLFILLYLLARHDERGVAADLFEHQDLNLDRSGRGDRAIFEENLVRHAGGRDRVVVLAGDSTRLGGEEIREAAGGPVRLLSVDGGHLAHIVRHDLATARDALCEGGVILVDDYPNPEFPGVCEGTVGFFHGGEARDLVPFLLAANKLYLTTRSHADIYLDRLTRTELGVPLAEMTRFRFREGPAGPIVLTELFGAPVLAFSPDRYPLARRIGRAMRQGRRRLRLALGGGLQERFPADSKVGRALRRVADLLLPH